MKVERFRTWFARSRIAADDGLAAVEFALVAPILLTLVFGIVVFGLYLGAQLALTQAAAEGARASIAGMTNNCNGVAPTSANCLAPPPSSCRQNLAICRTNAVIATYGSMLTGATATATDSGAGIVTVQVTYNASVLGLSNLSAFVPLPSSSLSASAIVSYGGY